MLREGSPPQPQRLLFSAEEEHTHSTMLPPPCFAVGMMYGVHLQQCQTWRTCFGFTGPQGLCPHFCPVCDWWLSSLSYVKEYTANIYQLIASTWAVNIFSSSRVTIRLVVVSLHVLFASLAGWTVCRKVAAVPYSWFMINNFNGSPWDFKSLRYCFIT